MDTPNPLNTQLTHQEILGMLDSNAIREFDQTLHLCKSGQWDLEARVLYLLMEIFAIGLNDAYLQ